MPNEQRALIIKKVRRPARAHVQVKSQAISVEDADALIKAYEGGDDLPAVLGGAPAPPAAGSDDVEIDSLIDSLELELSSKGNVRAAFDAIRERHKQGRVRD